MTALFLIFAARLIYLMLTPDRVRFDKYTEWSFTNPDGSERGVVVIDPDLSSHPDYHPPDAIRRYPREQGAAWPGWVRRLAWAGFVLVIMIAGYGVS